MPKPSAFLFACMLAISAKAQDGSKSSATIDPVAARRFRLAVAKVAPFEARARQAMSDGRYRDALKAFDEAQAKANSLHIAYLVGHSWDRIECHFQLKEYRETLRLINPKYPNNEQNAIRGICLIHLGRPKEARKLWNDHMATWGVSTFDYTPYLPGTSTPARLEASFRLARGLNRILRGANKECRAELDEALRLAPHQPLISAYLVLALRHLNLYELARGPAKDAANLPGPLHP